MAVVGKYRKSEESVIGTPFQPQSLNDVKNSVTSLCVLTAFSDESRTYRILGCSDLVCGL